ASPGQFWTKFDQTTAFCTRIELFPIRSFCRGRTCPAQYSPGFLKTAVSQEGSCGVEPLRDNVALAIDGGGIKGLIAAQGLVALEEQLAAGPLIKNPKVKVLAGTSTGALITSAIALGLSAKDIVNVYIASGQAVFPPLAPPWLPSA